MFFGFSKCTTAPPLAEPRWLSILQRGGIPGKVKSGAFGRVAQTKEPGVHQNGGRNDSLAVYSRPKAHTHAHTHTRGPASRSDNHPTDPYPRAPHTHERRHDNAGHIHIAALVHHFYVDRTHYLLQLQQQSHLCLFLFNLEPLQLFPQPRLLVHLTLQHPPYLRPQRIRGPHLVHILREHLFPRQQVLNQRR